MPFDPQLVDAQLKVGQIPRENLPLIAQSALEEGADSPSLRKIAGLLRSELYLTEQLWSKAMAELGVQELDLSGSYWVVVDELCRRIISGEVSPEKAGLTIKYLPGATDEAMDWMFAPASLYDEPEHFPHHELDKWLKERAEAVLRRDFSAYQQMLEQMKQWNSPTAKIRYMYYSVTAWLRSFLRRPSS